MEAYSWKIKKYLNFHVDSSSDPVAVKFLDLLDTFNPEQHIKRRLITVVTPLTSYSLDLTTMILFHMYP